MKSPRQQLYDDVFTMISMLGNQVYDRLPMDTVPYPFIVLKNDNSEYRNIHKFTRNMNVTLKIDTWYLSADRGEHDKTLTQIEQSLFSLREIDGYTLKVRNINTSEITDTTTNDDLLHGTIQVTYQIN